MSPIITLDGDAIKTIAYAVIVVLPNIRQRYSVVMPFGGIKTVPRTAASTDVDQSAGGSINRRDINMLPQNACDTEFFRSDLLRHVSLRR